MERVIVRSKDFNGPYWRYIYCHNIKDREEVWKALAKDTYLNAKHWKLAYYMNVCHRPEIRPWEMMG